jgi:hypothetical protein
MLPRVPAPAQHSSSKQQDLDNPHTDERHQDSAETERE